MTMDIKEKSIKLKTVLPLYAATLILIFFALIFTTTSEANIKTMLATSFAFLATGSAIAYSIQKNVAIHNLFLIFAIIFGIGYSIVIPFARVPDELAHFYRIFSISEGHLLTPVTKAGIGDDIPKALTVDYENYRELAAAFGQNLDYSDRTFAIFPGSALYSPFCYIPQTIAMLILRLFTKNVGIIFTGTRLFTLAFSIILIYFSIKLIPYGKITVFVISMLPMTLHQLISLSADSPTISLALFCVSLALYMSQDEVKTKKIHFVLLSSALFILSMCKIVYIVFVLLVFIIPKNKFTSSKSNILYKSLLIFVVVALNVIWLGITSRYFIEFQEGVNIKQQILYVFKNPFRYFLVLCKTFYENSEIYLKQLAGSSFGYYQYPVNIWGFGTGLLVLILSMFACSQNKYTLRTKSVLFIITLLTVGLTFSALYAQWTPVGSDRIAGVQGRYFIPLLLPISCFIPQVVSGKDIIAYENSGRYMLYLLMMFANFVALSNCFYYILAL